MVSCSRRLILSVRSNPCQSSTVLCRLRCDPRKQVILLPCLALSASLVPCFLWFPANTVHTPRYFMINIGVTWLTTRFAPTRRHHCDVTYTSIVWAVMGTSNHRARMMWTHGNLCRYFLATRSGCRNHDVNGGSLQLCWLNSTIYILYATPQLVVLVAAVAKGRNAEGELRVCFHRLTSHGKRT